MNSGRYSVSTGKSNFICSFTVSVFFRGRAFEGKNLYMKTNKQTNLIITYSMLYGQVTRQYKKIQLTFFFSGGFSNILHNNLCTSSTAAMA